MWPTGLLDRLRWADAEDRLGRAGLVLAGVVVAVGVEDAFLWGGRCPVRYRRLAAESGYSRSTVARLLPTVLSLLAEVGAVVYDRDPGGPYRVTVVSDSLAGLGVGWLPWATADASHRLHPGWSHTDRAIHAVLWGWAGWDGDVAGGVGVDGLAARAGLRPSTLRRRQYPDGIWNDDGTRLSVDRWADPVLDAHRRRVRYDDYRCSVPARSGSEGASVRWHGHTNQPEPDLAAEPGRAPDGPADVDELWGGLIGCNLSYTTPTHEESSGARPSGSAEKRQKPVEDDQRVGRAPPRGRCRTRWTPDRWRYEQATTAPSWTGPDPRWVTGLARRFGWHAAEQAALETDRVLRLGRPVRSPKALATHFARCFARPQQCPTRHRGVCGQPRLDLYRGRRLDENQQTRTATSAGSQPRPNPALVPALAAAPDTAGRGIAVAVPAAAEVDNWLPDPDAVLTRVAAGGPPRLAALARRLSHRLTTPAHHNNGNSDVNE